MTQELINVIPATPPAWAERSATIGKLAAALSKAQAILEAAKKDANNPFFKSKYADLSSVWAAVRGPLTANELSILQEPSTDNGKIIVTTTLMHSSGEYVRSSLSMPVVKQDPQGYGSAVTYARRYALQSVMGIAPEDDDGNAASQPAKSQRSEVVRVEEPRRDEHKPAQHSADGASGVFYYSIEKLEGEKFIEASKLLTQAGAVCKNEWGTVWQSPKEVKKLVNYKTASLELEV